jgi:hypothetical protein
MPTMPAMRFKAGNFLALKLPEIATQVSRAQVVADAAVLGSH